MSWSLAAEQLRGQVLHKHILMRDKGLAAFGAAYVRRKTATLEQREKLLTNLSGAKCAKLVVMGAKEPA